MLLLKGPPKGHVLPVEGRAALWVIIAMLLMVAQSPFVLQQIATRFQPTPGLQAQYGKEAQENVLMMLRAA